MNKTREAPSHVQGVAVEAIGEPMVFRGETWITLVPVDDDDDRLWEWCPSTGRIVQTTP